MTCPLRNSKPWRKMSLRALCPSVLSAAMSDVTVVLSSLLVSCVFFSSVAADHAAPNLEIRVLVFHL